MGVKSQIGIPFIRRSERGVGRGFPAPRPVCRSNSPAQLADIRSGYLSITTVAGLLKLLPQYGCHSATVGSFTQKLLTVATAALMCQ